jgi:hypothetical protein
LFSQNKLNRIAMTYRLILMKGRAAHGDARKHLFGITRRARNRLAKLGIVFRDRPDGAVDFKIKASRQVSVDMDFIQAEKIVKFIDSEKLTFGAPSKRGVSWALCLNTYDLQPNIADILTKTVPPLISEFAFLSRRFLISALYNQDTDYHKTALFGVPAEVRDLWRKTAAVGPTFPYCYRPDIFITQSGKVVILEFNVDTRLDRGIAEGVTEYSRIFLPNDRVRFVGTGIASAYADATRGLARSDRTSAATVINRNFRGDYFAQEAFFCKRLSNHRNLDWRLLSMDDLSTDTSSGFVVDRTNGQRLDLLNFEFELLDGPWKLRVNEVQFADSALGCRNTDLLGATLPFSDKLLFSVASQSGNASDSLKSILCPTWLLDEDLCRRASALHHSPSDTHYVLKPTGVFVDTTGSKGVVVSSDVSNVEWDAALEKALRDIRAGSGGWVLQPRIVPQKYPVRYRYSLNGETREDNCFVRLSAYYTLASGMHVGPEEDVRPQYSLAGAVATAGTDEETLRKGLFTIRGLRRSTYMGVTTTL